MLVPVPWQPGLLIHADLLVKLREVKARLGRSPLLYNALSGWRSYAEQDALFEAFKAGRGNIASDPDTGNRTHMRGVAADLQDQSQAMQRACQAVGLQRDPNESWHWQLSTWRNYPIVKSLSTPEPKVGDVDMRILYNLDDADESTRRALIGELSFQVLTAAQATRERKFWGTPVNVSSGEWDAARELVGVRRATVGLPVVGGVSVSADIGPVLAKLDAVHADVNRQRTVA